jgi:hypothetical protein
MIIEFSWDSLWMSFEGFQNFHGHGPPHQSVKGALHFTSWLHQSVKGTLLDFTSWLHQSVKGALLDFTSWLHQSVKGALLDFTSWLHQSVKGALNFTSWLVSQPFKEYETTI